MAEIVIPFAEKAVESLVDSTSTQLGYIWNYKSNFENLEKQLVKLQGRKDMVQHRVDEAKRNREEIEQQVVNWLDGVNKMIDEVIRIIDANKKPEMTCFKSLCPNLKERYQHSKNAAIKAKNVTELYDDGEFDRVSYRTIPKETWHPSSKLYEDFESRMSTLTDVINTLSSPNVNVVGFYGMGGIGKTTLAREVGRKVEEGKLFDSVHFVEISEQPDVMKIQGEIAGRLGLRFRVEDQYGRAMELCERLKQERKVLLILDNIWESLDLVKVGIPLNDDHRGCKLLLTARNINVLLKMDCQSSFPVGILNEKEAWNLFEKIAGSCVRHQDIQSLAFDVAKRCGGLPIAIVTIAKALKNKQAYEWRNAFLELQRPSPECQDESMTQEAYSCILLSYKQLKSDELKSTFLLCCTMVLISDASLEKLLRYGLGLNLFTRIKTMEEAQNRVNTLIQKLKDSSLLLETSNDEHFFVHDVVRDVGKAIALSNHKNFIVDDIRDLLEMNTLKNCTSISLLNIAELPKELNCPHLTFFYIETKTKFSIPDNFFNGMPKLGVLHLKEMDLLELPLSLRSLKKLRTLYLDHCNLGDIAIVGDMKNLKILVLFNSRSEKKLLSEEIGNLNQLRLLDLRKSHFIIPPKTISRLTQLEELYIDYWYDQRQVEELNIETSVASLEELEDLCHLTAFEIHVADAEVLPKNMVFQKLKRYKIIIGLRHVTNRKSLRTLQITSDTNLCLEDGVIKQLKGIEDLVLDGEQRITNVLCELDGEGFPKLKHFCIENNPFILCIVDSMLSTTCVAFPLLEALSLSNLVRLEKICHDQLRTKCFCQLRTIKVQRCHKLKNLFTLFIAKHLSILKEIEVVDCGNIEEIFIVDRADNGVIDLVSFKQLHSLTLRYLPRLRRICSEMEMASTSQERQMPLTTNASSSEIVLQDQLDALSLLGEKFLFPNLKHLTLHDINLKYVFSSSTLGSLNHLQHLRIKKCEDLEELIIIDDKCSDCVEFPPLEKFEICDCFKLREFIFSEKISYPSLQEAHIFDMANLKRIWQSQVIQSVQYCPKLCKVYVQRCQRLENIFPASIARGLLQLEFLLVENCGIKEIVAKEGGVEEAAARFFFPHLTSLNLYSLKELSCFYPGKHTTKWPKLKELAVKDSEKIDLFSFQKQDVEEQLDDDHIVQQSIDQAFFRLEKVTRSRSQLRMICQLKRLYLYRLSKLKQIWKQESKMDPIVLELEFLEVSQCGNLINLMLPSASFENLKILKVDHCDRLISLVPASAVNSLIVLEKMSIKFCEEMTEIIENEGDVMGDNITLSRLKSLELEGLTNLTSFHSGSHTFIFPLLEDLIVNNCLELKFFSSGALNTPNLQEVSQDGTNHKCEHPNLNETFKQIRDKMVILPNSKKLKLSPTTVQCKWLDQVPAISSTCQTLTSLTLEDCSGDLKFVFSSSVVERLVLLEELAILNCKSIEGIINAEELKGEGEVIEMVFPKLINLQLKDLPNLKQFGSGNSVEFPSLTQLFIKDCPALNTFASALTLEEMNCQDDIHTLFNEKVGFPSLENMIISGLDNVKSIWHDKALEDSFCKLKSVEVSDCQMLKTIFPSFLCGTLLKLASIIVKSCGLVEEIFDLQGLEKHSIEEVQLKALYVDHLSNLKHIWNEDPKGMLSYGKLQKVTIFLCPNLKNLFPASVGRSLANLESLEVSDSGVEKITANEGILKEAAVRFFFPQLNSLQLHNLPELTTFYQAEHTVEVPCLKTFGLHHCDKVKSPFFLVEGTNQGFPNLEELQLSGNAIDQVKKQGQVRFGSLKSLELNDHESTDDSPLYLIQIFGSLGKLSLNFGSYIEIFSDAEIKEHPPIKHLVLSQLYNLQQIWKQGSKTDFYSQNLESLQVRSCVSLTKLMPSSSSFKKLTILEVCGCEQLKNLLTFSTAKSLEQLEKLEVFDCKMLTEIVANEGAATEKITFSKMKSLSLSYLESLASFCPMKHDLNFPILESLVVNECPKMKVFSRGAMNTPRYCQLKLNWKAIKRGGEVDISTTIQQNMEKRLLGREDNNDPSID